MKKLRDRLNSVLDIAEVNEWTRSEGIIYNAVQR